MSQENHWNLRSEVFHCTAKLVSGHLRHLNISQDQIGRTIVEKSQCLFTVASKRYGVTGSGKSLFEQGRLESTVLGYQDVTRGVLLSGH